MQLQCLPATKLSSAAPICDWWIYHLLSSTSQVLLNSSSSHCLNYLQYLFSSTGKTNCTVETTVQSVTVKKEGKLGLSIKLPAHTCFEITSIQGSNMIKHWQKQQTENLNPIKPQTQVTVSKIQTNYHKCYFFPPTRIIGYGKHLVWNPGEPAKLAPKVDIHVKVPGDWCSLDFFCCWLFA